MLSAEEERNLRDTYGELLTERLVQLTQEPGLSEDAQRLLDEELQRRDADVSQLSQENRPPHYETPGEYFSNAILSWLAGSIAVTVVVVLGILIVVLMDHFDIDVSGKVEIGVVVIGVLLAIWLSRKIGRFTRSI